MELKLERFDKKPGQEDGESSPKGSALKRVLTGVSLMVLGVLTLGAGIAAHTVRFLRYMDVPQVVIVAGLGLLAFGATRLSPGLMQKLDPKRGERRGRKIP